MIRRAQAFVMLLCHNFEGRELVKDPQIFTSYFYLVILLKKGDWTRDKIRKMKARCSFIGRLQNLRIWMLVHCFLFHCALLYSRTFALYKIAEINNSRKEDTHLIYRLIPEILFYYFIYVFIYLFKLHSHWTSYK